METSIYRIIAWNFIQLRQGKQMSQEELSKNTQVSRDNISRIERGLGKVSLDNIIKLSEFFEVPFSEICTVPEKGYEINFRLRDTLIEKSEIKFSRDFPKAPKIRIFDLSAIKYRKIKIEKDTNYDFFTLEGNVLIQHREFSEAVRANQCLCLNGCGLIAMRSATEFKSSRLLLIQTTYSRGC